MQNKLWWVLLLVVSFIAKVGLLGNPEPGSPEEDTDRYVRDVNPDLSLPNVQMQGYPISAGYTLDIRALPGGKADVCHPFTITATNTEPETVATVAQSTCFRKIRVLRILYHRTGTSFSNS